MESDADMGEKDSFRSGTIYSCSRDDQYGVRFAQGIIASHTTVKPSQLSQAL